MWLAGPTTSSPRRAPTATAGPARITGASVPGKYSSLKGRGFSTFAYFEQPPGETPASTGSVVASPRRGGPSADLASRPIFKHGALPPAPIQAGSFQRFRYSTDPYEVHADLKRTEVHETKSKVIGGAFLAGGNARDTRRMHALCGSNPRQGRLLPPRCWLRCC
jgi:hypothetical protein